MAVYKTLSDLVNKNERYDINKITYFTATDDGTLIVPDTNVFERYYRYISGYISTYTVTEAQRAFYACKPELLSVDLYGTSALSWLLLMLNDRECASKFTLKKTIRIITASDLDKIYDSIVTKSSTKLGTNWATYLTMVDNV